MQGTITTKWTSTSCSEQIKYTTHFWDRHKWVPHVWKIPCFLHTTAVLRRNKLLRVQRPYFFYVNLAKGHMSFCHHLASIVHRKSSTFEFSPLKLLNQNKPNLYGMVWWSPFKIVSNNPTLHSK